MLQEAERLGYTDVWSQDSDQSDPFVPLALAAAWTERMRLGTAIVNAYTEELDKRDGYTQQDRKKFYDLVSQHASHATYKGFQLTTQGGLGRIGPFVDEAKLQGLARRDGEAVRSCRNMLALRLRGNGPQGGADAEALPRHDEP